MTLANQHNPQLQSQLQGINLYLIGMMGSGKSTTGAALAQALGYQFFDTDSLVETATDQSIPEIFAHQGEAAFRQLETGVLAELAGYRRLVIATGGGIVTQPLNWSYLHYGIVIWLDLPVDLLRQRLIGDMGRPLLQGDDWETRLQTLLEQRFPLYNQADVRVPVTADEAVESVVARTLTLIEKRIQADAAAPEPD